MQICCLTLVISSRLSPDMNSVELIHVALGCAFAPCSQSCMAATRVICIQHLSLIHTWKAWAYQKLVVNIISSLNLKLIPLGHKTCWQPPPHPHEMD